jgi:hypothetical protein
MEYSEKKWMVQMISTICSKKKQLHIYKIFKDNNEPISHNKNGAFINMNNVREETLQKLKNYLYSIIINEQKYKKNQSIAYFRQSN